MTNMVNIIIMNELSILHKASFANLNFLFISQLLPIFNRPKCLFELVKEINQRTNKAICYKTTN